MKGPAGGNHTDLNSINDKHQPDPAKGVLTFLGQKRTEGTKDMTIDYSGTKREAKRIQQ